MAKNSNVTARVVTLRFKRLARTARQFPALVDLNRLERAFEIAQNTALAAEDTALYDPAKDCCTCGDYTYRESERRVAADGTHYTGPCKHQLHHILVER